jgi:mRNA degradation ribonuclease J1/J2
MNINLYGHNKQWMMIDCGATFNVRLTENKTTLRESFAATG